MINEENSIMNTDSPCVSGVWKSDNSNTPDSVLREQGVIPYPDGIYRRWMPCKVLNSWEKIGFFGGKKYYFTLQIGDTIKDIRVSAANFYTDKDMTSVHMYSEDGVYWHFIRE